MADEKKPSGEKRPGEGPRPVKATAKPVVRPAGKPKEDYSKYVYFQCPRCKSREKATLDLADRYTQCSKCSQRVPVPKDQAAADEEAMALEVKQFTVDIPDKCIKCGKRMKKGSIVCIGCGFDYREGKKLDVKDFTVRSDEPMRGKVAFQYMVIEAVLLAILIIAIIVRLLMADRIWWEHALYWNAVAVIVLFLPMHIRQYVMYSTVPRRETPSMKDEDRAEREEAGTPYAHLTAPFVVVVSLVVWAIAFPLFGGETWDYTWATTTWMFWGITYFILGIFMDLPEEKKEGAAVLRTLLPPWC